ncbi:MAG TPA: LytTR family DNA-binding domain-containing protein [Gemmatimonadaceae bacterium]|nr:LytTR family DNA-binding domain-containing protein [Gemmatimonadaceae bacterium]
MREIHALVVDDEPLARRGIRQLLARHAGTTVAGECRNGREALHALDRLDVNLVFLDVQMPEMDGFAVIGARGVARMPATVFVTAYDEHAVRAFEAQALDYLVKPVSEERFDAALGRVRAHLEGRDAVAFRERLAALMAASSSDATRAREVAVGPRRLLVPTSTGDLVLDPREIDWIGADDYYAVLHVGGRRLLLRESLASLAGRLEGARFVRVHRSAIVNLDRVRELRAGGKGSDSVLVLRSGAQVPVSRRRREVIGDALRRLEGER